MSLLCGNIGILGVIMKWVYGVGMLVLVGMFLIWHANSIFKDDDD